MTLSRFSLCLLLAGLALQDGTLRSSALPPIHPSSHREQSQERLSAADDLKAQAEAHRKLGQSAWARGDLQEALTSFQSSLDFWQKHGADKPAYASTLAEVGEVLIEVGQPKAALERFGKAFELLKEQDDRSVRFDVANGAGMAHLLLENHPMAIFFYKKALEVATSRDERAIALHRLGTTYRIQEKLSDAAPVLKESRELARKAGNRKVEAYALAELAHLDDLEHREKEALHGFEQARQIFLGLGLDLYVASTLLGTAEAQRDLGDIEEAIDSIQRSIHLVERVRSDLAAPGHRVGFFAARHRYYNFHVQLLMEQARRKPGAGYAVEAFEASECTKARSLLDDMAGKSGPVTEAMTLGEIQGGLLDEESVLLAYTLGTPRSFLWVIRPHDISVHELPDRKKVEEAAHKAWLELSDGVGTTEVRNLSRMLLPDRIGPLADKRLLVSLDGLLHLIPFGLLRQVGDRMLFQDHQIVHVPSASVAVGMRQKLASRSLAPLRFAGVGDPVFQIIDERLSGLGEPTLPGHRDEVEEMIGNLGRLRFSRREIQGILELFPKKQETFTAFDFDANRDTALRELGRFQILHFATHHLAGGHPYFTGLVLSRFDERGRPRRSFVTAPEIYDLNLPAELVVLSACGTGLAQDVRGEGPVGLTRAFLHAGAKRVVVSLWSVNDKDTAALMRRFYEGMLRDKLSPAAALQAAQISMHEESRSSYRSWGAFVLQGEPR